MSARGSRLASLIAALGLSLVGLCLCVSEDGAADGDGASGPGDLGVGETLQGRVCLEGRPQTSTPQPGGRPGTSSGPVATGVAPGALESALEPARGRTGHVALQDQLRAAVRDDPDPLHRAGALRTLAGMFGAEASDLISSVADDPSETPELRDLAAALRRSIR